MLTLSRNQFSPNLFCPIDYEYSLGLFKELEWIDFIWNTGLQCHQLLTKIDENGQVVMVMSNNCVFLNKGEK